MNPSYLSHELPLERQREPRAQAERARRAEAAVRRVSAAAITPRRYRRLALRAALLETFGKAGAKRP